MATKKWTTGRDDGDAVKEGKNGVKKLNQQVVYISASSFHNCILNWFSKSRTDEAC